MLGIQKTIALLLLIFLGIVLKRKIRSKEALSGIKALILSVALPATIFVALLKVNVKTELLILPVVALSINFLMMAGAKMYTLVSNEKKGAQRRTLLLLIPSFAPGLSCFPFLTEYLGENTLAIGALADVGNKVFGLIILYLIAMTWYYGNLKSDQIEKGSSKFKSLIISLLSEPINIVICIAVCMLVFGLNFASLPKFSQEAITKLSVMMTPLVLIFIGLAVKVGKDDVLKILKILFWRSGFAFLLSTLLIALLPSDLALVTVLAAVALPQSSCSFWPFAHMVAVSKLDKETDTKTFDLDLAINILAFSLPFSTSIILIICSSGNTFANPILTLAIGLTFVVLSVIPSLLRLLKKRKLPEVEIQISQDSFPQEDFATSKT